MAPPALRPACLAVVATFLGVAGRLDAQTPRAPARASAPALILTGGKVFTADSAHPWAEALAIRTREQAVTMYTRGSAYAEFAERAKGTLAPGTLVDLAVLSQDIFTVPPPALPSTTSVLTMVGGKIVRDEFTTETTPSSPRPR
jgi:hypothetical protein